MNASHPLHRFNKEIGKTVPTQVQLTPTVPATQSSATAGSATKDAATTGDSLTFSRAGLQAKIATFERMSTDPNASSVAEAIRQLLLN